MEYKTFHDWILQHIPPGSNMLEFGSGEGTKLFTKVFNVTSIEHNAMYVGLDKKSNYIHAPIFNNWYNIDKLTNFKTKLFDVILIDGPPAALCGRKGMLKHLHLFNWTGIIVFDDLNRKDEMYIFQEFLKTLGHPKIRIFEGINRDFGVIFNTIPKSI